MKRFILLIVVVMLAYWVLARHRSAFVHPAGSEYRSGRHYAQDRQAKRHAIARAGHQVRQSLEEAGHEIRQTVGEASDQVHSAIDDVRGALLSDDDDAERTSDRKPAVAEREEAEGLPVRIVPGTRVTDAQATPPVAPRTLIKTRRSETPRSGTRVVINTGAAEIPTVAGKISATPERADIQAREALRQLITEWLDPDVPGSWSLPQRELDKLVLGTTRETVPRRDDYGPMYITHLKLDTTPARRDQLVKLFNHELVGRRLINLGGSLAFILMCLAAVSGYIRADEASKGYYTNRLRLLAAAGVGAGGVLIYQMVT